MSRFDNLNVPQNGTNAPENGTTGQGHSRVRKTGHLSRCPDVPFPLSSPVLVVKFFKRVAGGFGITSSWWVLRYELAEKRHAPARISGGASC